MCIRDRGITVSAADKNWIRLSGSVKGKQSCQVPDQHDQCSLESKLTADQICQQVVPEMMT